MSSNKKLSLLAAAALAVIAPSAVQAQTNGTWIGVASGNWSVATNWASGSIPDLGGTAFVNDFTGQTAGHTLTVDTSRTLGEINWNSGYSMTFATAASQSIIMGSSGLTLNAINSLQNSPISTFVSNSVSGQITGTGNLVKTGNAIANISNTTNSFTGNVNINAGLLWNNSGNNGVYGAATNEINLNGGIMGVATTALTTTRVINVNSASTLRAFAAPTMSTANQLRGSAALAKDGTSLWTIGAANANFTGDLRIDQGSLTLSGAGSIGGTGILDLPGTVNLTSTATAVNNRLSGRSITGRGGDVNLAGNASTAVLESLGTYNAFQGQGFVSVTPAASATVATDIRFSNLTRSNNGAVYLRGTSLGAASGAGVGNVYVTNAPAGIVGGGGDPNTSFTASIIPWAWANTTANAVLGASFATWDTTTQRIIPVNVATGYNTNINAAGATDNVNLTAAAETVAAPVTINALRFGLAAGTAQTVGGSQITVTSGAILNSSALASSPTVTVTAPITSGSAEMVVYSTAGTLTGPPQFQLNGVLSGTGGFTRNGSGSLLIGNVNNDYSGTTTFNGGTTIVPGSTVSTGSPSIFGQSGDIVLNGSGGTVRVWTSGALVINRNVVARLGHAGTLGIGTQGASTSESVTINGNVNLVQTTTGYYTNFLGLEGGETAAESVTINGVVSGGGGLRGQFGTYVKLNNANTYSGGTIVGATGFATGTGATQGTQSETWEIGDNRAFGTGTIWIQNFLSGTSNVPGPGTMVAGGGARTITNPIITVSGYARTAGSNPITWAGPVHLNGSAQGSTSIDVGATAPLTISGVVSSGGLVKNGPGTLTLSGNNTYSGRTVITNGVLSVGTIGNGGVVGNLGQAPGGFVGTSTSSMYLVLGGSSATTTGTLRYTGTGETTDRRFQITGYGGTIDASGSGPLVFSNTGALLVSAPFGSLTGATVVSGTSVISVGNINAEAIPVGTVISNALFPAGTTVTESNINFIRLSNVPSAAGTSQTITFTAFPSDFVRTLNLTGSNTGLNTLAPSVGEFSATINTRIVKSGVGTWNLTAALGNTYSGGTTVNGGVLLVNNTSNSGTGTGPVAVNIGGTLGGSGIISGTVTVNSGGTLAPGNSPGIITLGANLVLDGGSTYAVELTGLTAGTGYDQTAMSAATGTVTLGGGGGAPSLAFPTLSGSYVAGDFFTIIRRTDASDVGPAATGIFAGLPNGSLVPALTGFGGVVGWEIYYAANVDTSGALLGTSGGNDVVLVAVPEPTTLGVIGALSAIALRRRAKRA